MSYLPTDGVFIKERIDSTIATLKNRKFDAIAVRGMSGMLVGPAVAAALNKRLIIVRKTVEKSHAFGMVEGFVNQQTTKYVIIDDFVDTGATLVAIYNALYQKSVENREFGPCNMVCVGVVQHNHPSDGVKPISKLVPHYRWVENKQVNRLFLNDYNAKLKKEKETERARREEENKHTAKLIAERERQYHMSDRLATSTNRTYDIDGAAIYSNNGIMDYFGTTTFEMCASVSSVA